MQRFREIAPAAGSTAEGSPLDVSKKYLIIMKISEDFPLKNQTAGEKD